MLCSSTKFPNYPSGSQSHANHFENCLSQVESKLVFFCRFSNVFVVVVVFFFTSRPSNKNYPFLVKPCNSCTGQEVRSFKEVSSVIKTEKNYTRYDCSCAHCFVFFIVNDLVKPCNSCTGQEVRSFKEVSSVIKTEKNYTRYDCSCAHCFVFFIVNDLTTFPLKGEKLVRTSHSYTSPKRERVRVRVNRLMPDR